MKFHKLPHFTRDVTGQHYRRLPSDVSLPRISERRRRLKFRLSMGVSAKTVCHAKLSFQLALWTCTIAADQIPPRPLDPGSVISEAISLAVSP